MFRIILLIPSLMIFSSCKFDVLGDPSQPTVLSSPTPIVPTDDLDTQQIDLDIPVCYDHGQQCDLKMHSPFSSDEGGALRCRLFFKRPFEQKAFTQVVDFYSNCGSCFQAALVRLSGTIPLDVAPENAKAMTCDVSQVQEDIEIGDGWSYQVVTLLNGSTCRDEFVEGKLFAFPSAASVEGSGEDTCFPQIKN